MPNQPEANITPTIYEVRVEGCLPDRWSHWFDGLSILREENRTVLTGPVADQAALFGLLKKVRDLGMPLISVNRIQTHHQE